MVDPVRLARLLQRVGERLSLLEDSRFADRAALRGDELRLAAVKYRLMTAVESVLDVAHHLLASELWGPAESSGDALRLLVRHTVLDQPLGERLVAAVGLHNVLVHGYADVDDDLVVAALDEVDDLRAFVTAVRAWAAALDSPG